MLTHRVADGCYGCCGKDHRLFLTEGDKPWRMIFQWLFEQIPRVTHFFPQDPRADTGRRNCISSMASPEMRRLCLVLCKSTLHWSRGIIIMSTKRRLKGNNAWQRNKISNCLSSMVRNLCGELGCDKFFIV